MINKIKEILLNFLSKECTVEVDLTEKQIRSLLKEGIFEKRITYHLTKKGSKELLKFVEKYENKAS